MIQQAYKYVSLKLRRCLTYYKLKITNIFKSIGWGLEKSELPWEQNFFVTIDVFPTELLACQTSMVCAANWPRYLYLYTQYNIGWSVWRHQSSHLHILSDF